MTMKTTHIPCILNLLLLFTGLAALGTGTADPVLSPDLLNSTDLVIEGSTTQDSAEMGSESPAEIVVKNYGPARADAIRINMYLVPNQTPGEKIWVLQKTADQIPPFYQDRVPFSFRVPQGIVPGDYFLVSTISTTTTERNETNNQFRSSRPIHIRRAINPPSGGLPDLGLTIDSIHPLETGPDYPFSVNYTVRNTGDQDSGSFRIGLYLSPDQQIEPSDVRIGDEIYYGSYPGMQEKGRTTDIIPQGIPAGVYYLGGIIDFTHMVSESDTTNNMAVYPVPVLIQDLQTPVDEALLGRVAGNIVVKTNRYRELRNLPPLRYDPDLGSVALGHSLDMASRTFFSHLTPEGVDPTGRAERAGYDTTRRLRDGEIRRGIAENIIKISAGYTIGKKFSGFVDPSDPQSVADVMMIEWISSPDHDKNLLDPNIDRIGVGITFDGEFFYGTQNFY